MRASNESYEKVAQHCSEYKRNSNDCCKNSSAQETKVSCLTCSHFDSNKYCKLNLFDKIKEDHNF